MFIRMIRPWRGMRQGQVLNHPDGAANLLVQRGYAEQAQPSEQDKKQPPQKPKPKR